MYQVYEVRVGDTLESILDRTNLSEKELRELNGFYQITPGFQLVIPKMKYYDTYVVQKGDTLYNIAQKYGIPVDLLAKMNGKEEEDYLYIEEVINVPKENTEYYVTKKGESLSDVLSNTDWTLEDFFEQNKTLLLEPDQIFIYQKRNL